MLHEEEEAQNGTKAPDYEVNLLIDDTMTHSIKSIRRKRFLLITVHKSKTLSTVNDGSVKW